MSTLQAFSFVQITDLHVGFEVVNDAAVLAADLRQLEQEVGDRVAFGVVTGDLTNYGRETQCRTYLEALRATRLKLYPVIGNHDYADLDERKVAPAESWYRKLIAPLNYSFDHAGVHFVSYDSMIAPNRDAPTPWLRQDLAALPPGTPIIFLTHDQLPAAFYNQLQEYRIVATLSGHWHSSRLYHDGRIAHYNGPTFCFGGIDYSPRGYRVFTWDGNALHCQTVPLRHIAAPTRSAAVQPEFLWSVPLRGEVLLGSPVVAAGRVFLGLLDENRPRNGAVVGWDARTGAELWRTRLDASVKNTVVVAAGRVIAVTVTGEVVALDARDGQRLWTHQLGDPSQRWIFSSPVVVNGQVFVGQGPQFVALDVATGRREWVRTDLTTSDWISSYVSPASDGTRVFVGFYWQSASLCALAATNGETVWKAQGAAAESYPTSPIRLDGRGGLYVVTGTGPCRLEAATGQVIWHCRWRESWNPGAPGLAGDTVYAPSGDGKLYALAAATGDLRWAWESGGGIAEDLLAYRREGRAILSSPQIQNGLVWIGANDGTLTALDQHTGRPVQAWEFGQPVTSTPAFADGTCFLAARDGTLYAWNSVPPSLVNAS